MSWRRLALPPLLSLTWACGGDGGPAQPGDAPDIEDSWAFAESFADAAHTVSCINEGTFGLSQTNVTFTGQGYQTGTCQTPGGTLDNGRGPRLTAQAKATG